MAQFLNEDFVNENIIFQCQKVEHPFVQPLLWWNQTIIIHNKDYLSVNIKINV